MCGIAAFAIAGDVTEAAAVQAVNRMTDFMKSRGPDASAVTSYDGMVLGHRRLAILDLDPRANQPLEFSQGRYSITFNGEIYNFQELRDDLQRRGTRFRTTSDTEVLLALFAESGEAMLQCLRGMFAFVIWDRVAGKGFAARDAYGIKPLYYTQSSGGVMLASEVKALLSTGLVSREPDPRGQASFWMLGSVSEPRTWYRAISALPAGHFAWIEQGRIDAPRRWWDISAAWRSAPRETLPAAEVRERVRAALRASVNAHLVADVPVGVFLSGGIDSGTLAGLMVEAGASHLQGFTLGFQEFAGKPEDESPVAARIAAHYGIEHHVRLVSQAEFDADLPRILAAMDQPSIDGVNTWYASKVVAEHGLKVVVSGVGGDELFQGYSSFRQLPRLVSAWRPLSRLPGAMAAAGALAGVQARRTGNLRWKHMPDWSRSMGGAWWLRRGLFGPGELPALMGEDLASEALANFVATEWVHEMSGVLPENLFLALGQIESTTYLRNQLLRDSDWASMDHSVELRTPLVDSWLLRDVQPLLTSFVDFPGKALLAGSPERPLPADILQRRKTGFGIPVDTWLKSKAGSFGLRPWAHYLSDCYVNS
ncbi:MAG: asparagine synthase (glutamine-hydrolyzing) [Acidobacteriota bacterium]